MAQTNNKTRYGNIITTIAIAVFLVFWTLIDRRLQKLEDRLRNLELQVTAISAQLGIDTQHRLSSTRSSALQEQQPARGKLP